MGSPRVGLSLEEMSALGFHDGVKYVVVAGRNHQTDASTSPVDIWHGGGLYTGFPDELETIQIVSNSAEDNPAGTGAHLVRLLVLDGSLNEVLLDVVPAGLTPVIVPALLVSRFVEGWAPEAGSNKTNVGDIIVRHTTTTANVFASVPADHGNTEIAAWTCPAGRVATIKRRSVRLADVAGTARHLEAAIAFREAGTTGWRMILPAEFSTGGASVEENSLGTLRLHEGDDIVLRILHADVDGLHVTGRLELLVSDAVTP